MNSTPLSHWVPLHFFLIPSPNIQCVKWSNCKSTMADPHQVSLHISAPLTDLPWRSGLQNDLIPVPLDSCSALFQFQWAKCRGSHITCPRWAINRLLLYSDLPRHGWGRGEGYPFKNHASTMYKQEICVLTTVFMNVPTSWTLLHAGKKNKHEWIKPWDQQ